MWRNRSRYPVRRRGVRRVGWVLLALTVCLLAAVIAVRQYYYQNLRAVGNGQQSRYVTVASGTSAAKIGDQLKADGLIRSSRVFGWYIDDIRDGCFPIYTVEAGLRGQL